MKKYFTIGETAKINRIPVKTLRFYDEKNLLKPAYTNVETGYRYYSPEQFYLIDIIKYGKSLELSLDEIKSMMAIDDVSQLTNMLKLQKKHAQQKVDSLKHMVYRIDSTLDDISYVQNYDTDHAPYSRYKPEIYVAYIMFEKSRDVTSIDVQLKKITAEKSLQPYLTYKYGFFLSTEALRRAEIAFIGEYIILDQKPKNAGESVMPFAASQCDCFQYPVFNPDIDLHQAAQYIKDTNYPEEYVVAEEVFYNPEWKDCIYELCFNK